MDDRSAGLAIFVCATALFAYYTVWVLVTPFVEPGHVVLVVPSIASTPSHPGVRGGVPGGAGARAARRGDAARAAGRASNEKKTR